MAGPSPERFQRALTTFKRSLSTRSPDLLNQFSVSSLQDLQSACHDMQNEMGRNGRLRRMRRMQGFIEAMEQLGRSIEVFVNANDLVCFIWGPVKFLLGIAKTHVESLDKLLDVYEQVGSMIPGLLAYRSMLEKHPPLATVLEDYYSDILRFHEAALKVFTRPRWKQLFKAAWKTFDTEFQPLLQSLANRRELLESEKGSASLYEISKVREEMAARHEAKKEELRQDDIEKHKWRLLKIKAQLEAPDYQQDQEMAAEARNLTNAGDWVSQSPAFKNWVSNAATRHGVLYVHGIPGAGKTTLVSSIVAKLLNENGNNNDNQTTLVAYFYMKHEQPKDTHNSFLRAMMEQIISRDSVLSDHLFHELTSIEGMQLRSTKCLELLITTALETYQRSFIVIDGLDEAAPGEAAKPLNWLLSLVNDGIKEPTASTQVLCSGRRDGLLDSLLSDQPAITLESSPEHNKDILKYCEHMSAQIQRSLDIPSTIRDEIVSKVADQANGMFLYARVVLDNLLGQITLRDLRRELQPDTFPKGIDQAYERVAIRMLEEAPDAARQAASKILGWVACAARPLRWREIQSTFCIDVESSTVDYEENRLRVSCKKLCGSLVDVHQALRGQPGPDDIVTIVHESAREYLVQKRWINSALEHAKAATFCFRYLTSKPFCGPTESISLHVRQGYYGFQDYAVKHCLDHLENYTGLESPENLLEETMESARVFLATYSLPVPQDVPVLSHRDISNFFNQLPKDKRERADTLTIGYRTLDIRTVIEKIRIQDLPPQDEAFIGNVYGKQVTYKCPKIWCDYFSMGFDKNEDRQKHVDSHNRPFRCSEEDCFAFQLGYSSKSRMEEHKSKYHSSEREELRFPQTMVRRDNDTLLEAAGRNDLASMLAFLESGAAVDGILIGSKKRPENRVPIYRAAKNGHAEACKLLLDWGANLLCVDYDSPMYLAIEHNHPEVMHCLLSGLEVGRSYRFQQCIYRACKHTLLDIVRQLLESSYFRAHDIEKWKPYARDWIWAACQGSVVDPDNIAIIKYLLEKGFSDSVESSVLSNIKNRGGDYMASLLQPSIDNHTSSDLKAEEQAGRPEHGDRAGRNHALQYYQMQFKLLEQQDAKRRMMMVAHKQPILLEEGKNEMQVEEQDKDTKHALPYYQMELMLLKQQEEKRGTTMEMPEQDRDLK